MTAFRECHWRRRKVEGLPAPKRVKMTAPYVTTVTKPVAAGTAAERRLRSWLLGLLGLLVLLLAALLVTWLLLASRLQTPADRVGSTDPATGAPGSRHGHRIDTGGKEMVCFLPLLVGPCRGAMPRFFFNVASGACEPFLYGGCEGNSNNFKSEEDCRSTCGSVDAKMQPGEEDKDKSRETCALPPVTGDCRGAFPRYHYDAASSQCREFTYGGCGGNGNNFKTMDECRQACSGDRMVELEADDCSSPPEGGNCMAYMERYAYDRDSNACKKFVYGGCGGNGNRYDSLEECEQRCKPPSTPSTDAGASAAAHDTRVCGVSECPADCGRVGPDPADAACLLCQCGQQPFLQPGQLAVALDDNCPPGYAELRRDFAAKVCAPDVPVPIPA